jgi:hypothetical protein
MLTRGGEIQMSWPGMGQNEKFRDPPVPFVSVKLLHLGHLGLDFKDYYGGKITWDELGSLNLEWGENEVIQYNGVQPGWTYWWEIGIWEFTVTDELGNKTVTKAETISDLGITWDILESPQFSIHLSGKFENDSFLLAWKYKPGYEPPDPSHPRPEGFIAEYLWGEFDKYLNNEMHAHYQMLIDKVITTGNPDTIVDMDLSDCVKTMILAKTTSLAATGNFPLDLIKMDLQSLGEKEYREAGTEMHTVGNLLMIHIFASIMNGSKSAFEPWMLWKMWQWFGSSGVVVNRDRIFDLSPWWGE